MPVKSDDKSCLIMDKSTQKTTVTIPDETADWLIETYPDALSLQEAVRMAISDARSAKRQLRDLKETTDD